MTADLQVEAVEHMVTSNTITVAHSEALLKATPPERDKTSPFEPIVKLEKEMSQVQTQYKDAEWNYGPDLLNQLVAKGYLTELLSNEAVNSYTMCSHHKVLPKSPCSRPLSEAKDDRV